MLFSNTCFFHYTLFVSFVLYFIEFFSIVTKKKLNNFSKKIGQFICSYIFYFAIKKFIEKEIFFRIIKQLKSNLIIYYLFTYTQTQHSDNGKKSRQIFPVCCSGHTEHTDFCVFYSVIWLFWLNNFIFYCLLSSVTSACPSYPSCELSFLNI